MSISRRNVSPHERAAIQRGGIKAKSSYVMVTEYGAAGACGIVCTSVDWSEAILYASSLRSSERVGLASIAKVKISPRLLIYLPDLLDGIESQSSVSAAQMAQTANRHNTSN